MSKHVPHGFIYRYLRADKMRSFRYHALCGQGRTGGSSMDIVYEPMWEEKGRSIRNHAPFERDSRERFNMDAVYRHIWEKEKEGVFVTMSHIIGEDEEFECVRPTLYAVAMRSLAKRHSVSQRKLWLSKPYHIRTMASSARTGGNFFSVPYFSTFF